MNNEFLKKFYQELALDTAIHQLQPLSSDDKIFQTSCNPAKPHPFDSEIKEKDIRLLPQPERLTYIAVLRQLAPELYLAVPYSHFSVPADDREILSENESGLYLHVLQLWNTTEVAKEIIAQTWKIGTISSNEQDTICKFIDALNFKMELSAEQRALTSVPMTGLDDPRQRYFHQEKANLEPFLKENMEVCDRLTLQDTFQTLTKEMCFSVEERMAAGREKKNPFCKCRISGFNEIATIEYAEQEQTLRFKIYAQDNSFSNAFDKWKLVGHSGEYLGTINAGRCIVKNLTGFDGRCCLIDLNDDIYSFEKIEEGN